MLGIIENLDFQQTFLLSVVFLVSFHVSSVILITSGVIYMFNNLIKFLS